MKKNTRVQFVFGHIRVFVTTPTWGFICMVLSNSSLTWKMNWTSLTWVWSARMTRKKILALGLWSPSWAVCSQRSWSAFCFVTAVWFSSQIGKFPFLSFESNRPYSWSNLVQADHYSQWWLLAEVLMGSGLFFSRTNWKISRLQETVHFQAVAVNSLQHRDVLLIVFLSRNSKVTYRCAIPLERAVVW